MTPLSARAVIRRADLGTRTAIDSLTLDRASRYRRRILMTTDGGRRLLLDLAEATYLADGDALETVEGLVLVKAAAEPLMEVRARDALHLARIAWHLGNRHTPTEITADALYLQPDHVLADMIRGLGGEVVAISRPFEPEGGAYGGHGPLEKGHHHHGHGHSHGHAHDLHHHHEHAHIAPAVQVSSKVWKG